MIRIWTRRSGALFLLDPDPHGSDLHGSGSFRIDLRMICSREYRESKWFISLLNVDGSMPYWLQSIVYAVSTCLLKIRTRNCTLHELLMIYCIILYVVKPFLGSVVCAISQPWFYVSQLFSAHRYYIQYSTECIQKCNISIIFDPSAAHLRIMGFSEAWSRSAVSWICNELEQIRIIPDPAPDNCSSICKVSWSHTHP